MAYYFDPENADDLKLLKSSVRDDAELENIANATEDMIREMYSEWNASTEAYDVKLRGYLSTADPDDLHPEFKKAYKQTIADVISYRLINYNENTGVKRERRGKREKEWFDGFDPQSLPNNLFSRLNLFDTKVGIYYV